MSKHLTQAELQDLAIVSDAPVRTKVERNFGLPTGLYVATVALYLGFIGLMATLFHNPELAIPMVVFAGFIIIAFGLAGLWTRMEPDNDTTPMTWGQFGVRGIDTPSGRLMANEATVQVLMLPVLILGWGLAIAVIVAFT